MYAFVFEKNSYTFTTFFSHLLKRNIDLLCLGSENGNSLVVNFIALSRKYV